MNCIKIRIITRELFVWLIIALSPLALPFGFALLWFPFYHIDFLSILGLLLNNGVFMFFALTILISLFQDYRVASKNYKVTSKSIKSFLGIIIFVCSYFTFVLFGSFLEIVPATKIDSQVGKLTLILLVVAIFIKILIEKMKFK